MRLSEFKERIKDIFIILKTSIKYSFQLDTAYPAENWSNIFSTTFYIASYLAFVTIIYSNVKSFAGYSYDEMLFFTLLTQIVFYADWGFFYPNLENLILDVNRGNFDLVLTKPLPHYLYSLLKRIRIISLLRDAAIPTIMIAYLIDFGQIHTNLSQLLSGGGIIILGIICLVCFQTILALPVFWIGESRRIMELSFDLMDGTQKIPFEGFGKFLQILMTTVFPLIIPLGLATSVILGKLDALPTLIYAFIVTCIFLILRKWLWKKALLNYTSASS